MSRVIYGNTVGTPINPKVANESKADVILDKAAGTTIATTDSTNVKPKNIKLFGKSTQDGTPSIETPIEAEPLGKSGSIKHRLLTSNLLNPNACNRSIPCTVVNSATFQWITTDVDLVQGKTYYTGYSINGVYGHYLHYINYDIESSSQGVVTKVTDGVFVAKRSGKLCFRADAFGGAIIDNLFISEVYVEEFEPYTEQPFTFQTPNGLKGIGNVADEISFEDGKHLSYINRKFITRNDYITSNTTNEAYNMFVFRLHANYHNSDNCVAINLPVMCNKFIGMTSGTIEKGKCRVATVGDYGWKGDARIYFYTDKTITTIDEFMNAVGDDMYVDYVLAEPTETPLTEEELAQFNALVMNYPNTTIVNDANAYMEVEYVADTKCYVDNKIASAIASIQALILEN